ncbi:MAG: hypothetical protein U1F30_05220 [Steroidobacteraceae bacterium]
MPGKSPIRVSTVHRRIAIDTRTGQRACADTPARFVRDEVFEFWPSDIQKLFAQSGMPRRRPPAEHCPGDAVATSAVIPAITAPVSGATYQLRQAGAQSLQLNATAGPDVTALYWFADGAFLGTSRPSVALSWAPSHTGEFSVSVVDDHGASATRRVRVAALP